MRKFSTIQKILIWVLAGIFTITIGLTIIKPNFVKNVSDGVFNVVTAVRYSLFEGPINASNKQFKEIINLQKVTEENQKLHENVLSMARDQAYITELERKNVELTTMLEFKDNNSTLNLITSRVIFRDFERWNNTVKIDVGSNDGVSINDAVILPAGLIGRVEEVTASSSVVRLLISPDKVSKVAVKIEVGENKYVDAIIDSYNADENAFELSLLETSDLINVGDRVVTSGSGGLIPSGILVGDIKSQEASVNQLGDRILVKSYANFSSFENVFVAIGSNND